MSYVRRKRTLSRHQQLQDRAIFDLQRQLAPETKGRPKKSEHPDLAAHDLLGLATQAELDNHQHEVPHACVYRATDYGPISHGAEQLIGWDAALWDNGAFWGGSPMWDGDTGLSARKAGVYSVYAGLFLETPPSNVRGQLSLHVKLNNTVVIMDPHTVIDTYSYLVGPSLCVSRDWRFEVGQFITMAGLYQYFPLGYDLVFEAGQGQTYLGMTWRGP